MTTSEESTLVLLRGFVVEAELIHERALGVANTAAIAADVAQQVRQRAANAAEEAAHIARGVRAAYTALQETAGKTT